MYLPFYDIILPQEALDLMGDEQWLTAISPPFQEDEDTIQKRLIKKKAITNNTLRQSYGCSVTTKVNDRLPDKSFFRKQQDWETFFQQEMMTLNGPRVSPLEQLTLMMNG